MNTNRATRFAGLIAAVLMTAVINGAMLLKFDATARQGTVSMTGQSASAAAEQPGNMVIRRRS